MNPTSPDGLAKAVRKIGLLVSAGGLVLIVSVAGSHAQQTAPPTQPPAQEAPPPPLPNRVNEILPGWLRVRGEFRDRMEGFTNAGFTSDRDDLYWLNRFRLNATMQPSRLFAFSVQAQDARVQKKTVGSTGPPFRDVFDLRMAFADVGDPQQSPFLVRVGRQEFAFGEQRLVGHLSWLNNSANLTPGGSPKRGTVSTTPEAR